MAHASSVLTHASDSWLMRPTSNASGVRRPTRQASGVRRPASGVRRPMRQASGVRRQASHASGVRRQASHASGVRRQTPRHSFSPFSRRPVVGHDDNRNGGNSPMLFPSDLRPLSYMAWGNRVVLPNAISSTGAIIRITTAGGAFRSAARCCYSTKKGRHTAGLVPDVRGYSVTFVMVTSEPDLMGTLQ